MRMPDVGFKSVLFLVAIGGIFAINLVAIPLALKAILILCAVLYIIKYCWMSYIEFQVDNPDFINQGCNKLHKDMIERKARKNKKV